MTSAQVVEPSVINKSSYQNFPHPPRNHVIRATDTPGFKKPEILKHLCRHNLSVWMHFAFAIFLNLTYWTYSSRPQMAGMNFILMTTFPNKELTDDSQKLSEANLLNAVIVQRFKWVRTGTWWLVMDEEVWHWIKMHATRTWLETRESDFEFSLLIGCREWSRTPGLHLMGFMTLVTFYCPSAISANNYK